jgi:hypothetical protein
MMIHVLSLFGSVLGAGFVLGAWVAWGATAGQWGLFFHPVDHRLDVPVSHRYQPIQAQSLAGSLGSSAVLG